jgi:VCBS repeat protein
MTSFRSSFSSFVPVVLIAIVPLSALAQQFQENTAGRIPAPFPSEYSEQVDLADIDGDGDLDILFGNGRGFASPQLQEPNRLYINDGSGFFTDETSDRMAGVTGFTRDVEFADVDNDGDVDCLIVNAFNNQPRLLINDGDGFFNDETNVRLPLAVIGGSDGDFGDVDNDGDLDLILSNSGASPFGAAVDRLYLNDGNGVFTDATATNLPGTAIGSSIDCDFFDMDGDGDLDLIMGHRDPSSRLWENDGTGVFTDVTVGRLPSEGGGTYSYDAGDIDGDGDLDLLCTRGSTDRLYHNNGSGVFGEITATNLPINPFQDDNDGELIDIDNDGDLDAAIARLGGGGERIYVNNGAGVLTLTGGLITVLSDSTLDIEFADINGDGRLDCITAQGESGSFVNRIYIGSGPADTRPPTFHQITQIGNGPDDGQEKIVRAAIRDVITSDTNFFDRGITLHYRVGSLGQTNDVPMRYSGGDHYRGVIPNLAAGSVVRYWITAVDFSGNVGQSDESLYVVAGGVLGDNNGDAAVDVDDMADFVDCVTGPTGSVAPSCTSFDFDGNQTVDFVDFGLFQLAYTG